MSTVVFGMNINDIGTVYDVLHAALNLAVAAVGDGTASVQCSDDGHLALRPHTGRCQLLF